MELKYYTSLFLLALLGLWSCDVKTAKDELKNNNYFQGLKSDVHYRSDSNFNYVYTYNDSSKLNGFYFVFYKHTGILKEKAFYSNDTLSGYVEYYDSHGSITRKALYGKNPITFQSLVENIEYDSSGEIDLGKSFFMDITPYGEVVNVFDTDEVDLKIKLNYRDILRARVIINFNGRSDTLVVEEKHLTYRLKEIPIGISELEFVIHAYHSEDAYAYFESYRKVRRW